MVLVVIVKSQDLKLLRDILIFLFVSLLEPVSLIAGLEVMVWTTCMLEWFVL